MLPNILPKSPYQHVYLGARLQTQMFVFNNILLKAFGMGLHYKSHENNISI